MKEFEHKIATTLQSMHGNHAKKMAEWDAKLSAIAIQVSRLRRYTLSVKIVILRGFAAAALLQISALHTLLSSYLSCQVRQMEEQLWRTD